MEAPVIKMMRTDSLIPYVLNARTHSSDQVSQIAASIKEFGFTNPVLVDGDKGIIAGHGRVMAAQKLGLDEIPVIELSYLSEAQKKAYILADNKLALNAGWDDEILRSEINFLKDEDYDLSFLGFNENEIEKLFEVDIDIKPIEDLTLNTLVITCDDETTTKQLFSELQDRGFTVKIME